MFTSIFNKCFITMLVVFCLGSVIVADTATVILEEPVIDDSEDLPIESSGGTRSRAFIDKMGDWVVSGFELYNGDTIRVTGNLYIETTGTLVLINVRLIMNCSKDPHYMIQVNASNGALNAYRTTIRSINARFTYKFKVNGTMTLNRCTVTDLWGPGLLEVNPLTAEAGGIEIRSDAVVIQRSTIKNYRGYAITCMGSEPKIDSNLIQGNLSKLNEVAGIYTAPDLIFTQSPRILGNNITNCSVGIRVDSNDPIIRYNNISIRQGYNLFGIVVIAIEFIIPLPANPLIEENNILNNGVGIALYSADGTIQNNEIKGNGLGIFGLTDTNTEILGNTIENNFGPGINLTECSPDIIGNDVLGNRLWGIGCDNSDPLIQLNTIVAPSSHLGIACFNGSSPTIDDNDITSGELGTGSGSTAIMCNESSAPTITNNDIILYDDGIGITSNGASPTISQNDMSVDDNCIGVLVDSDSVAIIEDNKIDGLPSGGSKYGIEFDNNAGITKSKANNNTIENFSYGLRCFKTTNLDIEYNPVKNIVEYGIYVLDSYGVNVSQNNLTDNFVMIENSSVETLSLINSNATSLNSTLGQQSVDKDSHLTMMWYLDLTVTDSLDAPIEGANVTIYNSSNVEQYEFVTPTNGEKKWIRCVEYIQEDRDDNGVSEQNPNTPHTIIAEKAGLHPGSLVTDISTSKSEILVILPNQLPIAPSGIAPFETHNLTPNITWLPGSDPDNDTLTYHISIWEGESSTTGNLIVDDNTTKLSYFNLTPELQYGGGNNSYYLELQAEDGYGGVTGIISHDFYVINHPPIISNLSDKALYAGEVLWFNVSASDSDADPVDILVFSEDSAKFEIDPDTGEVYWVTTNNDIGVYEVEFKLEDGNGGAATKIINITVLSLNLPPIPDAGNDLTVMVNLTVILNGSGSVDEDGIIIGYEWECITYNVTFENANSSAPSFTPTLPGKYIIHLRVLDDNSTWSTEYDVVNITVEIPMEKNSAPVLKNGSVEPSEGTDQINYTFTVEYFDKDNDAPAGEVYVRLTVDSTSFNMTQDNPTDTNYRDGALFTISLDAVLFGTGNHTFWFEAYDGEEMAVGDIDGHSGPTINPYKPTSQDKDDDKKDQLSDFFWLLVLIVIIIVIVVIVIVAAVLYRKKREREAYYPGEPYEDYDQPAPPAYEGRRGRGRGRRHERIEERPSAGRGARGRGVGAGAAQPTQIDWDEDRYPEEDYGYEDEYEDEYDEEYEEEYDVDEEDEDADWAEEEDEDEADWEE